MGSSADYLWGLVRHLGQLATDEQRYAEAARRLRQEGHRFKASQRPARRGKLLAWEADRRVHVAATERLAGIRAALDAQEAPDA